MTYKIKTYYTKSYANHKIYLANKYPDALDMARDILKNIYPVFSTVENPIYRSDMMKTSKLSNDTWLHFYRHPNQLSWAMSKSHDPIKLYYMTDYWVILEGSIPPALDTIQKFLDNGYMNTDPNTYYSNIGDYFTASQQALKESKRLLKMVADSLV